MAFLYSCRHSRTSEISVAQLPAAPDGFKVSKGMLAKLPEKERDEAASRLWVKSGGLCALCDQPLPTESDLLDAGEVEPDHHVAEHSGTGGVTALENLYLAHKSCNRRRRNLQFDLAHAVIKFATWSDRIGRVTFENVAKAYLASPNRNVRFRRDGPIGWLDFGTGDVAVVISEDPATKTEYFFAEIPVEFVQNDAGVQPRVVEHDHVAALAQDFVEHPVHEPSNCRLVHVNGDVYSLLQFDGQHKTTAQIILGRETVPMKVYVSPSIPMIQDLVISIQQRIKKRPLSTSDTLLKISDVVAQRLASYVPGPGKVRSEQDYVASQPLELQGKVKQEWLQELERLAFFDDQNKLRRYVSQRRTTEFPTTDSVVIAKLVRPFIYQGLLNEDMDNINGRDHERKAILIILNTITERMLEEGWVTNASKLLRRRAQNFLYQGSIGWWVPRVLMPAIQFRLEITKENAKKPFVRPLTPEQEDKLRGLIEQLCSWEIWSLDDTHPAVKAMKSNVPRDVAAQFPDYHEYKLLKEVVG